MQRCPLPLFQERFRPHWGPIRRNLECCLRRIHHHVGSFVRLLFLIQVGPSANFCTRNRNMFLDHIGKPSEYFSVCIALWGLIPVLTGVTHGVITPLLGHLRVRVFSSELALANFLCVFSRNCREPCSSFRNGTSAVNSVYELLSSRAAVC